MQTQVLVAFALAVLPLSLTPGASSTLVMTRVLAGGTTEGVKVAIGTICGLYVHATAAAIGLAAVVMASATAFTVVKLAGALYLVALGVSLLRQGESDARRRLPWTHHGSLLQAFLGNVLNPKAAGVYLTLLPQFIDPGQAVAPQIFALATVHAFVALTYLTILSHLVSAVGGVLTRATWRAWLQRASGIVLILLGLRTALGEK